LLIEPLEHPEEYRIEPSMQAFRKAVNVGAAHKGKVEVKKLGHGVYAVFNKDRYLTELAPNRQIGDDIIAIVQGAGNSKIDSIVSGIDRSITIGGRKLSLIQTSSKLKREGLMLNRYGQIIGVHTRNLSTILNCGEDTCFFIPSIALKEIVDELITQGYVSGRPSLGVDGIFLSLFDQYYYNIPSGLYITSVIPGSSADTLGLRMGDVLISVNGEPISDSDTLNELLCSFRVGDDIYAIISRNNQLYQIELTVAEDRG
jgi:serine protease Do